MERAERLLPKACLRSPKAGVALKGVAGKGKALLGVFRDSLEAMKCDSVQRLLF